MERSRVAYCDSNDSAYAIEQIVNELKTNDEGKSPKLILFSADYLDFSWFSRNLSAAFPNATVIGMSTYVVFSNKGCSKSAVSAMALYSGIECKAGIILDISKNPMKNRSEVENALASFDDTKNMCCIEFISAFSSGEELVLDTLKCVLEPKKIPVFGGTAGADTAIKSSFVSLNGIIYNEACVFVLVKNLFGRIGIFRENMFKPTEHFFTATDVDCDERTVYEYDYRPAAEVIAECLAVPVDKVEKYTSMHPVGRLESDNIYITENNTVFPDGRISYFARIYNYTKLVLLEPDDVMKVWDKTESNVKATISKPSFSIVINCLSRSRYFEDEGILYHFTDKLKLAYGKYLGFSGYGEQAEFEHLNQTMLIAVFE